MNIPRETFLPSLLVLIHDGKPIIQSISESQSCRNRKFPDSLFIKAKSYIVCDSRIVKAKISDGLTP